MLYSMLSAKPWRMDFQTVSRLKQTNPQYGDLFRFLGTDESGYYFGLKYPHDFAIWVAESGNFTHKEINDLLYWVNKEKR